MATVYKAYDSMLEREVAIKIIRREAFPPEILHDVLKRFEREAKALARLSHPNIVKVLDFGEHDGSPFLVLEYLSGGTLKQKIGTTIPWQEAVRLLLPIARGIEYAHRRGVIHRDIKPANILLTEDNEPMLSDFGIAKIFGGEQTTHLTGTGMAIGTPEYMAPEQWTGDTSVQSDIYALGIVGFVVLHWADGGWAYFFSKTPVRTPDDLRPLKLFVWGDKTEVMYGMHHWPSWGRERCLEILEKGRDGYRYINDQTLRLANHGFTPVEIAEQVEFPPELASHWAMRGYYGSVNHNVKATYTKYLGWFDGNPATLHTLPPEEAARKYAEMMGGAARVVEAATKAYADGEYRWSPRSMNVFYLGIRLEKKVPPS